MNKFTYIFLTILYSSIWVCCICLIFGFFMPTPVAFYKRMRYGRRRTRRTKEFLSNEDIITYDILDD